MDRRRMRAAALVGAGFLVVGLLVMAVGGQWFSRGGLFAAAGVAVLAAIGASWFRQRRQ